MKEAASQLGGNMEVNVSSSSKKKQAAVAAADSAAGGRATGGSGCLSMYAEPPSGIEISLEGFEEYALDRLRLLKTIEEATARGRTPEEMDNLIDELWRRHIRVPGDPKETQRKDTISHFVLRLASCRTEELRRWFLEQECTFFRHRFRRETAESERCFMEETGLPYRAISAAELQSVHEPLNQVMSSLSLPVLSPDAVLYSVPFEDVPDLLASRRVFLQKGSAFVPRDQLCGIVVSHFRTLLSKALVLTNRKWLQHIKEDEPERLSPILEGLSSRDWGDDYSDPAARGVGVVGLIELHRLAKDSFPMCMRHLYHKLREDHHLKNGGRIQLGLFLKGIGLRLEDALSFWRAEFSKKMGADKFDKGLAYAIRHDYTREGKRTDNTPYSCAKITQATPGVGNHHGCPFKHFSEENLRAMLGTAGLPTRTATDVVDKARNHHYQIACSLVFEATQKQAPPANIWHPNEYFELSIKARKGTDLASKAGMTGAEGLVPPGAGASAPALPAEGDKDVDGTVT